MADYLILQLAAAIGAMGGLAGHERRGTQHWPARSAVTGLLGAALGRRRDADFSDLDALGMAVAVFDGGAGMRDFHTVQTVPAAAVKNPRSRPHALREAKGRLNTTVTQRDYRCGLYYGVALWGGDLQALAAQLQRPVFQLYFGRKSCPLSAPLDARVVQADGPAGALSQLRPPPWITTAHARVMAADEGAAEGRLEVAHDMALDRRAWHFAPRNQVLAEVDITAGEGAA